MTYKHWVSRDDDYEIVPFLTFFFSLGKIEL